MHVLDVSSFHDGIECSTTAWDVVRFNGEHFAERVCRAVAKQCPHFHLTETLSTELRCLVCQNQSIDESDAPLAARHLLTEVPHRLVVDIEDSAD